MDKSFLKKVCESEEFSDCSFIFPKEPGKVIKGHRLVLAAASPILNKLFQDSQTQSNEGCVIEIKDVESTVFKNFLRLIIRLKNKLRL